MSYAVSRIAAVTTFFLPLTYPYPCVFQVKYILENNIDDSELAEATGLDELTFSEEVYDQNGRLSQVNPREKQGQHL